MRRFEEDKYHLSSARLRKKRSTQRRKWVEIERALCGQLKARIIVQDRESNIALIISKDNFTVIGYCITNEQCMCNLVTSLNCFGRWTSCVTYNIFLLLETRITSSSSLRSQVGCYFKSRFISLLCMYTILQRTIFIIKTLLAPLVELPFILLFHHIKGSIRASYLCDSVCNCITSEIFIELQYSCYILMHRYWYNLLCVFVGTPDLRSLPIRSSGLTHMFGLYHKASLPADYIPALANVLL